MQSIYTFLVLLGTATLVFAQEHPRTNRVTCAIQTSICARAYLAENRTVVTNSIAATRTLEVLWSVPTWLYVLAVTEDGSALLAAAEPYGRIPSTAESGYKVLKVFEQGRLRHEITLGELLPSVSGIQLAIQQQYWGRLRGTDVPGQLRIELVDGRVVKYDLNKFQLEGGK